MSLFLIRHGETALNVSRVLQPPDVELSERGQAQAAALAARLAGCQLSGIVCSDLRRARQTADHLATATGLPITSTELLRERNFGDWRGQAYDRFDFDPVHVAYAPPAGESMQQFLARAAAAFEFVVELQSRIGGRLAVVSHGLVLMAMLERHARADPQRQLPRSLRNTSLSIVDASAPHAIDLLDDISHLDAQSLAGPSGSLSGG